MFTHDEKKKYREQLGEIGFEEEKRAYNADHILYFKKRAVVFTIILIFHSGQTKCTLVVKHNTKEVEFTRLIDICRAEEVVEKWDDINKSLLELLINILEFENKLDEI
jgi:hypothetical protein